MEFKYLDLPALPDTIVESILSLVTASTGNSFDELQLNSVDDNLLEVLKNVPAPKDNSLGILMSERNAYFKDYAKFEFLEVNQVIKDWINSNIFPIPVHIGIQCMHSGKYITPHIDEARKYAYNYIIETGDAHLCLWEAKDEYTDCIAYPQTIFPYERIKLADKIVIDKNKWHLLDTNKIHSVENISGRRISLSLSYV